MTSTTPLPFRADQVGSLLRPASIHHAREQFEAGNIDTAELCAIEDDAIIRVLAKQEQVGLQAVTDGEFRRAFWHFDFFRRLNGVEIVAEDSGMAFHGVAPKPHAVHITDRISFPEDHPMLEHFRFVRDHATVTPKQCIPAPTVMHFRLSPETLRNSVYANRDELFADLAQTWRDAVHAFYEAGCRYLQLDDTAWAYLCSDVEVERAGKRRLDTNGLAQAYAELLNSILRNRPSDMTITTHVCRGNFRSTWIASGGYEPMALYLLGQCDYDGFFLEYDSDRAGGFEPLRFLPEGDKRVVLGLITSKSGMLEDDAAIRARIAEASAFVPLDQLALSPQCGFASTEEGNVLTEEQQWAKLTEVVRIADEVWGFPVEK